ncbi:MAG: response regulator, partial [Candidatus Omnitrophica bacterium]|nr:response regulator [Candidatus Omnitrophota bacterium]
EIRTPMNGVIGMVDMLLETKLTPRQREFAKTIESSAGALLTILNDILDFSKIEAGRLRLESIPFSLQRVIEEIGQLHAARAGTKDIDLIIRYRPTDPLWLQGDPVRVRQIINNLVGNALKFTPKGHVLLEVEGSNASDEEAALTVRVIDTGIGIPKEDQERVFEKFTQSDSTSTRDFGGTGLGLSISRQLAELMGGTLTLKSETGHGSTFTFAWTCRVAEPISKGIAEASELAGYRVLVVDDNEVNRRVAVEYLSSWGMQARQASSGEEALQKIEDPADESSIDLFLIDHNMPGMDGIELTEKIREVESHRKTPVILYTSSHEGVISEVRREGLFQGILQKPLRPSRLLHEILAVVIHRHGELGESEIDDREKTVSGEEKEVREQFDARILVVEDNQSNQFVAKAVLGLFGCRIDLASNGMEGIEKYFENEYDLVFMDCFMPVVDGFEATRRIRDKEPIGSRKPIVAMTAHAVEGARDQCLEAGMDDYLTKPLRLPNVREVLLRFLSHRIQSQVEAPSQAKDDRGEGGVWRKDMLMENIGGDESLLSEIVEAFLEDMPPIVDELSVFLREGEFEQVERKSHQIGGSAANLGGEEVSRLAYSLEKEARERRGETCQQLLDELTDAFQKLEDEMRRTTRNETA